MERDQLLEPDISAQKAVTDGFYLNEDGQPVEWRQQIDNALKAKISIPPDKQLEKPTQWKFQDTEITVENDNYISVSCIG